MILFRCDAGPEIGFGHLTRCRTLARALIEQGEKCILVGPDKTYERNEGQHIFCGWEQIEWDGSEADATYLIKLLNYYDSRCLILDDYRIDESYQLILRKNGIKWLQFETRINRPIWADIVLNANPAAIFQDYSLMLHNPEAILLLGPQYALLRPEFKNCHLNLPGRKVKNVLVTMGGGNDRGSILYVLKALLPFSNESLCFRVVSGKYNSNNMLLLDWVKKYGNGKVQLLVDPPNMAEIMVDCDIAITSGGTLTYELAACAVPMVIVAISEDQNQSVAWQNLGAGIFLGQLSELDMESFRDKVFWVIQDQKLRFRLAKNASGLVDSKGAERTAKQIILMDKKNE